jgi:hypothetical protein
MWFRHTPQLVVDARWSGIYIVLSDLYFRLMIAEHSLGKSLDEFLCSELAELYIRVVVAEYSLEKLSKLKLQVKIKHEDGT